MAVAYAPRVKWLIALLAVAVCAGIVVAVWLATDSGSSPSGFASARKAVLSTCHADPTKPVQHLILPTNSTEGFAGPADGEIFQWSARNAPQAHWWLALVTHTHGRYTVAQCKMYSQTAGYSEIPSPAAS